MYLEVVIIFIILLSMYIDYNIFIVGTFQQFLKLTPLYKLLLLQKSKSELTLLPKRDWDNSGRKYCNPSKSAR